MNKIDEQALTGAEALPDCFEFACKTTCSTLTLGFGRFQTVEFQGSGSSGLFFAGASYLFCRRFGSQRVFIARCESPSASNESVSTGQIDAWTDDDRMMSSGNAAKHPD